MESHVLDLIHTITFLDVIDILVVAYFLNKLYQMLKNTRAGVPCQGPFDAAFGHARQQMAESVCDQLAP